MRLALAMVGLMIAASPAAAAPDLDGALRCSGPLAGARLTPVLLVHGTGTTSAEWDVAYADALRAEGRPWCAVDLPDRGFSDIQAASEYVVHALRRMGAEAGRPVGVIGHSQGGLEPRWALRFWPDLEPLVSDVISFGTPHRGFAACREPPCEPAFWQMNLGSLFLGAVNAGDETPGPAGFTSVFTRFDEVVPAESSVLAGAANIDVRDVCPGHAVEHYLFALDPVAFAIAQDALDHPGPARAERVRRSSCLEWLPPGSDPAKVLNGGAEALLAAEDAHGAKVDREPPLACYAGGDCPAPGCTEPTPAAAGCPAPGCTSPAACDPRACVVPRLRGRTLRAARRRLAAADCRSGRVTRVRSRLRRGAVVRSRPGAGARRPAGARVALRVSAGRAH